MCNLKPVLKQFLTIVCCNLLTLSCGQVTGWATINFNDLENENSTFPTGPLTKDQLALVVSIWNVGGFLGNFVILPLTTLVGIKRIIHYLGAVLLMSASLIIYAQSVYFLYVSRFLGGLAAGALVVAIPTMINDICFDNVRGALNSLFDPLYNTGVIICFLLGNYLSCMDQARTQLVAPVIFIILMFLLPESPEFWEKRNNKKKATKSRRFYKGSIAALENVEFIPKLEIGQIEKSNANTNNDTDESNSKLTYRDFLTPHAKRAFFISFTSLSLSFLSGTLTILAYVTKIFTETGSSLSEKNSSLLISITQIIANLVMLNIVERFNRRTLYIWSSFLTTASYFLFAAYALLWIDNPKYEWMPPFCFACIVYFSCMGLLPIPYIITTEIFPKKIRQVCLALAMQVMWVILFVLGLIMPRLMEVLHLHYFMMCLGVTSLLNALFCLFFVPETKGKSFEQITQMLSK